MFRIRKAIYDDIKAMAEIERECIPEPWSVSSFEREFSARGSIFLAAVSENDEICGFITANAVLDEINIYNIAVKEKFRRQGIAMALLCELDKENAEMINLEVRESNSAAIALYEKCGFEQVGMRKNFYSEPVENAVLMTKKR